MELTPQQMRWCEINGASDGASHMPAQSIIDDPLMRHSAILVFANKQDLVRSHFLHLYLPAISELSPPPLDCLQRQCL